MKKASVLAKGNAFKHSKLGGTTKSVNVLAETSIFLRGNLVTTLKQLPMPLTKTWFSMNN